MDYQKLKEDCDSLEKTVSGLAELLLSWEESRAVLKPIERSLNRYLERAGALQESWLPDALYTLGILQLMSSAHRARYILSKESRLGRKLEGAEYQVLNNVISDQAWSFRLFWLEEALGPNMYLAREAGPGEPAILLGQHLDQAVAMGKFLVAAVWVAAGCTEYHQGYGKAVHEENRDPEEEHHHHALSEELPVYLLFGNYNAFRRFGNDDLAYIFMALANGKFELPLSQDKIRQLSGAHADFFFALGLYENDEDDGQEQYLHGSQTICWSKSRLALGKERLLEGFDGQLTFKEAGGWQFYAGEVEDEEVGESEIIQLFFSPGSRELHLRSTGMASYSLVSEFLAGSSTSERDRVFPALPEVCVDLAAALGLRELLKHPLPGPPKAVLDLFELEW